MTICIANTSWEMEFKVRGATQSDHLTFFILTIINETITGEVRDAATPMNTALLSGRCSPLINNPEVSVMHFDFNALDRRGRAVRILMNGMAHQPEDPSVRPVFNGGFVAIPPLSGATTGLPRLALVDTGDIGTGNGNQT